MALRDSLHRSAAWYLTVLAGGVVLERYANYLWFEIPLLKGQATNILVAFGYFVAALVLWWMLERRPHASGLLLAFLVAMGAAWLVHWTLYRIHGDAFNYTAFLYVPILIMLALKPPNPREARTATLGFAWTVTGVLLVTRALEMIGALDIKSQPEGVIEFDIERYFLPLNELLGIDGRWPGPFGHNGDTAMMGALIIVIAFVYWSRASWVFLAVGGLTLLITNGRASMGAVAAGLVIMAMFVTRGPLTRIARSWRITVGAVALLLGAAIMYLRPAGLTGRENIWPAFLDLWQSSPLIGVGGSGISVSGGITQQFGHAHSLYIDELARYGLVGALAQFTALGLGLTLAGWAAGRGRPGPLAVLVAYFVTGVTEPRNSWITPSATGFLVILTVAAARAELRDSDRPKLPLGVRLQGGLGNQLFGFAAGLAQAQRLSAPLVLETSRLSGSSRRVFELGGTLGPRIETATSIDFVDRLHEGSFAFDPRVMEVQRGTLLDGYFQSWRYFDHIESQVGEILRAGKGEDPAGTQLASNCGPYIGVQVRRGDYLSQEALKVHGICSLDYYRRGVALCRAVVGQLPARVFSDDRGAAESVALGLDDADLDDLGEVTTAMSTLLRLSRARALVISNSSFGWWAGWLAGPSVPVVAPRPWFSDPSLDTSDLLPPPWITLDRAHVSATSEAQSPSPEW